MQKLHGSHSSGGDSRHKDNIQPHSRALDPHPDRDRELNSLREEIDRFKLENYHLKTQLSERDNREPTDQRGKAKLSKLEEENQKLKASIKSGGIQQDKGEVQDKYHKALREIGKLLKSNSELRGELEYMREVVGRKDNEAVDVDQMKELQSKIMELQLVNEQLVDQLKQGEQSNSGEAQKELYEAHKYLKEREEYVSELEGIIDQNQEKYHSNNIHFQNLINEKEDKYSRLEEEARDLEFNYKEQLDSAHMQMRENQRELESFKTSVGYLESEVSELRGQLEQLEIINEQLKRGGRDQSFISESSAVVQLKTHIHTLTSEVEGLKQFNSLKEGKDILAENQMLERQVFNLNLRSSTLQKQLAEARISLQEFTRKYENIKAKFDSLQLVNSQLEDNFNKKDLKLNKMVRENDLLKGKILNPTIHKAIADMEAAEDIDIDELKLKIRSCSLILQLLLNDLSSPKEISIEELQSLKTNLVEIDIKVSTLIEENDSFKSSLDEKRQTLAELEDINCRLVEQSSNYQHLIHKLEDEFEKSIARNEALESNHLKELKERLESLQEQSALEVSYLKQEIQTKILDYEVKLATVRTTARKSQMGLHAAYQQKHEDFGQQYRDLERSHSEAIRQLRVLGPEKEETIARLYSSIHDLELELKLYKNSNEVGQSHLQNLVKENQSKAHMIQTLESNVKDVLSSQTEKISDIENYKLDLSDFTLKLQNSASEVEELFSKLKVAEAYNLSLSSQLQICKEVREELSHNHQVLSVEYKSLATSFNNNIALSNTELAILENRVQTSVREKEQIEELKARQQKNFKAQLNSLRNNYHHKLDDLERNYQQSVKIGRTLQQKVDDLTLINIQLFNDVRAPQGNGSNLLQRSRHEANLGGYQGETMQYVFQETIRHEQVTVSTEVYQ